MKLPDVAVFAPFLSARPLLSCHWSIVALFVCRCSARLPLLCSSAVALLVCRWSIVGLLESVLLSCRCPVAVLSLSCRCPVAGLPLVCLLGSG